MTNKHGYAAYANNRIMTSTPGELRLMLYEGAIKFCNIAVEAMKKKELEKAHVNIIKVENIIMEFQATLKHEYPVSKDFDQVYSYLMKRLVDANVKKDPEVLEEVLEHLRTMRDTWKEVMRTANAGN